MTEHGAARAAEVQAARAARAILSEASSALQLAPRGEDLERAVESLARATSTLYELEIEGPASRDYRAIRTAIGHLSQALGVLQGLPRRHDVDVAIEALARSLALLYPVARTHQRKRRKVIIDLFGEPDSMAGLAAPAPEPMGAPPPRTSFAGENKRAGGERVFLEVDIGLASQSHFYTGLSRDLSRGGLFVATYQPLPPDTEVELHFVLPSGRAVQARGVVRWTVDAAGDAAPGMGIAFRELSPEDLSAIMEFCEHRAPLYHHGDDD